MPGHETHVDGSIPCARNGHGLDPTPIPEARLNILFAVYYVDGRSAYITLSPKKLASGEHVVPARRPRAAREGRDSPRRDQGREAGAVIAPV